MEKYTSLRVRKSTHEVLSKEAKKIDLSLIEYLDSMIFYFEKTGQDPREITNIPDDVKKLKNQLISFIRKQEKEKLNPALAELAILLQSFKEYLEEAPIKKDFSSLKKNIKVEMEEFKDDNLNAVFSACKKAVQLSKINQVITIWEKFVEETNDKNNRTMTGGFKGLSERMNEYSIRFNTILES